MSSEYKGTTCKLPPPSSPKRTQPLVAFKVFTGGHNYYALSSRLDTKAYLCKKHNLENTMNSPHSNKQPQITAQLACCSACRQNRWSPHISTNLNLLSLRFWTWILNTFKPWSIMSSRDWKSPSWYSSLAKQNKDSFYFIFFVIRVLPSWSFGTIKSTVWLPSNSAFLQRLQTDTRPGAGNTLLQTAT